MLAVAIALVSVPELKAVSAASKRAEAVAVKAQIDRLDTAIEIAAEDYDVARGRLALIQSDIRKEQARIDKATKRVSSLQGDLNSRASSMYRSGPVAFIEVLLQSRDFAQFASTWDTLRQLNVRDATDVISLNAARAEARAAQSWFAGASAERNRSNASVPRRAYTKRQGWAFIADGAQRAASRRPISVSTGSSSPVKARGDQRSWKSGSIECSGVRRRAGAAVTGASRAGRVR